MKRCLAWVVATTAAFGVGWRLGSILSPTDDSIVTGYLAVTASLLLAGTLQWLTLRRVIVGATWWIPASFAAVTIIGLLVFGLGLIQRDVAWVLGLVMGWFVLGVFQWLMLREQQAGAAWWILANSLGLVAAIPAVAIATWATAIPADEALGSVIRWLAFGAAYGCVTATALFRLLREPIATPRQINKAAII